MDNSFESWAYVEDYINEYCFYVCKKEYRYCDNGECPITHSNYKDFIDKEYLDLV